MIIKSQIPNDDDFNVNMFLASEVEKTNWVALGLSSDNQSIENGILTIKSKRYALCIDPQLQAIAWIKKMFETTLKVKTVNDD